MTGAEEPVRPTLRIVRGAPGEAEIAALVAVLAAGATGAEDGPAAPGSQWSAPARLVRPGVTPSGWWASALPR